MTKASERLDRTFDKIAAKLPWAAGVIGWVRNPKNIWIRLPVALLLIVGSIFSFLPLLGLWMLPVGLLLLAIDLVFLQDPVTRWVIIVQRKWQTWRRKK